MSKKETSRVFTIRLKGKARKIFEKMKNKSKFVSEILTSPYFIGKEEKK